MMDITPIGIVHSPFTTPGAPPSQSTFPQAEGGIEIFQEYHEGLVSTGGFSHMVLLSHFDRAKRRSLVEKPLPDGVVSHGIFASRHFNRLNPIGISHVEPENVDGGTLCVRGPGLPDGTPVPDIRPCVPAFDSIQCAGTGRVSDSPPENTRATGIRVQKEITEKAGQE